MIVIKGRELIIPNNEYNIGTNYDNNSEYRVFRLPRTSPGGVDLANLNFTLDLKYRNGSTDSAYLVKEVTEDYITLTLLIQSTMLQVPGTVLIMIRAINMDGVVKWTSYEGAFFVEAALNTPASYTGELTELERLENSVLGVLTNERERQSSEDTRKANERIRVSSENARVAAEAQRVIDFNNAQSARQAAYESAENARGLVFTNSQNTRQQAFTQSEAAREGVFNEKVAEFVRDKAELKQYADTSKSYAVGETGTRTGEDSDNAKHYSQVAENKAEEATTQAQLAATYAAAIPPMFNIDFNTMHLIEIAQGTNMSFSLTADKHLQFEYCSD